MRMSKKKKKKSPKPLTQLYGTGEGEVCLRVYLRKTLRVLVDHKYCLN